MLFALYVAAAINVLVAYGVSRSRRAHLTLVVLFSASLLSDLTKRIARTLYVDSTPPYAGLARAAFHVGEACVVTWPVGLAAAALVVFCKLSARPVLIPARLLLVALVIGYPVPFRGHWLAVVYATVSAFAFVVGAAGAVVSLAKHKRRATVTESVLVGAVCAEGLTLAGPHLGNVFEEWHLAQLGYGVFYIAAILIQLEALWGSWNRSGTGSTN